MDNKNIQSILHDALEKKIPSSQVELWTAVKASLVAGKHPLIQQGEKMNTPKPRRIARVAFATLGIIVLLALAFVTPQGRAFAQRIIIFFIVTDEKSFPIPTEQIHSVPAAGSPVPTYIVTLQPVEVTAESAKASELLEQACTSLEAQSVYFCQIKTTEAQAGFDAKELPYDPEGLKFSKATFDPTTKTIDMEFVAYGGYLYLSQGLGEFPKSVVDKWGTVPADAVEQVTVNGQYAELVSGTWNAEENATTAVWVGPGGEIRLRWREGNRWFSLAKIGEPYPIEWMGGNEIVGLAESLVDERPLNEIPPVDPEYLTSVEAAEELAGFDVLAPTLLPMEYELKRAAWTDNVVRLFYGHKDSTQSTLLIFMGRSADHKVEPSGGMENVQIGPWRGWYWRGLSLPAPTTLGLPTPVPNPRYQHLVWNTDTLWISLLYISPNNYDGQMNKETLIKIAESLK